MIKKRLEKLEQQVRYQMFQPVIFVNSEDEIDYKLVGPDTVIIIDDIPRLLDQKQQLH
jgi:hypothetical protein